MNDKPRILLGLVAGLVGLTFPLWYSQAVGRRAGPPELDRPVRCTHCVEDARYMRAHHMDLLVRWRDAVVREGRKTYVSKRFGESHPMSLAGSCLGCHTHPEAFCDRCHAYTGVARLACWDCHVEPKGK